MDQVLLDRYFMDLEACMPSGDEGGSFLQLDERIEISSLPEVFETTL